MVKTHITKITIVALIMLFAELSASAGQEVSWFRSRFGNLSWSEVNSVVKTPRAICSRVRHRIKYRDDTSDTWASGSEAWNRGYGDCEDIAAAIVALCKEIGVTAEIVVYYSENDNVGHAVVIGEWEGKTWIASNGWYQRVGSMNDAKRSIAREMGWDRQKVSVARGRAFNSGIVIASKPGLGPVKIRERRSILR